VNFIGNGYTAFWYFSISKHEIPNPKQYQMIKIQMIQTSLKPIHFRIVWKIRAFEI